MLSGCGDRTGLEALGGAPVSAAGGAGGAQIDAGRTAIEAGGAGGSGQGGEAAAGSAGATPGGVPRPIAPLSPSTVTSQRPTLRWELAAGLDGAHVDLCQDRGCAVLLASFDAAGAQGAPAERLPAGVVYWRIAGLAGGVRGASTSPVWQFTVGHRSAPVDTSWGAGLDVNGDGYADLAVGAPFSGDNYTGETQVFLGGPGGLAQAPAAALTDPEGRFLGAAVASAGDVNGDGYEDLVVGATNTGTSRPEWAYVYFGGPGGVAAEPSGTLTGPGGAAFGQVMASAGDVNGDGYADLVVGAFEAENMDGEAYVYFGGPGGLSPVPGLTLSAPSAGDQFGSYVASAGDVNGDGYADLAVLTGTSGQTYVYLGGSAGLQAAPLAPLTVPGDTNGQSVACAGDVNGDGFADLVVGTFSTPGAAFLFLGGPGGPATPPLAIDGPDDASRFGALLVGAGDVNGDGDGDVLVGAFSTTAAPGAAYVYLGGAGGLSAAPGAALTSGASEDSFGSALAGLGDVNSDGYDDVAVGAPGDGTTGKVFVFLGGPGGTATAASAVLVSSSFGDNFGATVALALAPAPSGRPPLDRRGALESNAGARPRSP